MSPPWRSLLFVSLLVLAAPPVEAVTVENLHTATVEVADKSAEARREAFRTGLERVLVKVAGTAAVLDRPGVSELLESPAGLVQQYRYEPLETGTTQAQEAGAEEPTGGDAAAAADEQAAGPRFRLTATFAGGRIEQRLEQLDIVVWGRQRPQVLVWLAVDDPTARRILAADGDSTAHRALRAQAQRRALPVLLPLMDAEDRSRVEFVDISGGFHDTIRQASDRYRGDILLVGHVRRSGTEWRADWTLLGLGERRAWSATTRVIEAAVASGVDGATERLAALLAGKGGEQRSARVRVLGIDSLAAYARVSAYFDGVVRVESARLREASPDALVFDLAIQGRIDEFERAVTLGDLLVPANDAGSVRDGSSAEGADEAQPGAQATGDDGGSAAAADERSDGPASAAQAPELVFRLAD